LPHTVQWIEFIICSCTLCCLWRF